MNITMKKTRIVVFLIIFFAIIIFNDKFMPVRKEITELELIKIVGMDKIDDGEYQMEHTILRATAKKNSSSDKEESEESSLKSKFFSVKGVCNTDIVRGIQTYTDKTLSGSHLKCTLLGEEFCKQDLRSFLDFNIRDYEVRLNTSIYITKGTSAKEFITKTVNSQYELDEKVQGMEKNGESKSISVKTTATDLLKVLTQENGCGLVPTLKIISAANKTESSEDSNSDKSKNESEDESKNESEDKSKNESEDESKKESGNESENASSDEKQQVFQDSKIEKSGNAVPMFDFDGYAIIYNNTLKAYLTKEESITTNILKDISVGTNLNIENDDGKIISFGILRSGTKYKAKFENNHLSEIIINTKFESNFDEILTNEDVFTEKKISELELKQEEQIKKQIEKVIERLKECECDFLNITDKIKVKYPFKFSKIEENFQDELLKAKFTINVDCNIKTTYDILSISN
jgi:Ger(x)C family germination protein